MALLPGRDHKKVYREEREREKSLGMTLNLACIALPFFFNLFFVVAYKRMREREGETREK